MIISLANLIIDHDPMTVARRTQDTMRYIQAEWRTSPMQNRSTPQSSISSSAMNATVT